MAARQSDAVLAPLGLRAGQTPCQSTLQRLLVKLDSAALSDALSTAMAARVSASDRRGSQGIAIDGKAQRGRLQFQSGGCPVHDLAAVLHGTGIVLAQEPITAGSDRAEAELAVVPTLLARLDWTGMRCSANATSVSRW